MLNLAMDQRLGHLTHIWISTTIRIKAHKLEVEIGRYTNKNHTFIERNRRYCLLCLERENKNVFDDEIHAMMIVQYFRLRKILY